MKNFINKFSNISECISAKEKENFKIYEFIATFNKIGIPSRDDIINVLDLIPTRDKVSFSIKTDYSSKIYLSNTCNIDEFCNELKELITNKEQDEKYYIDLMITKNMQNGILSIYSLKSYEQFLISQQLEVLNIFSKYLTQNKYIIFECQDEIEEFYTSSLYFISKNTNVSKYIVFNKNKSKVLNIRNDVCSFLNAAQSCFIPDDFSLIKNSGSNELNELFDKLKTIVSISFICNICSIDYDKRYIYYKINGYRTIKNNVIFEDITNSFSNQIYCIYEWIYNDGNLSDKIGLARNIITLHINDNDLFTLERNALDSIKSSYEIYLKENVTQYLQLRANINQSLNEYLLKTEQVVDNFISIFHKYLIGVLTFIISVVVMNCVYAGKNNLINIITGDIGILALGLLICSIIGIEYIIKPEITKKFNRYESQYKKLKESYDKLLNKEDLNDIFNDDIYLIKNREDIEASIKQYSKVWYVIILVLASFIIIA